MLASGYDTAITCHELTIDMVTYTRPRQDQQEALTGVYGKNIKEERKCVGGVERRKGQGSGSGYEQETLYTCMKLSENK